MERRTEENEKEEGESGGEKGFYVHHCFFLRESQFSHSHRSSSGFECQSVPEEIRRRCLNWWPVLVVISNTMRTATVSSPADAGTLVDSYISGKILQLKEQIATLEKGEDSLEEATGLTFRFIIGKTRDKAKMSQLSKEVAEFDDFVLLDIEEEYNQLSLLLAKERSHTQTYLGCMKKGPVFIDPKLK